VFDGCVTGTDSGGNVSEPECILLAMFDPDAGFVTGGGWIDSPEGAFKEDESLMRRANFGFVSRYQRETDVPTGNTQFRFRAGDLNFHGTEHEWLVVTGNNTAGFKGQGIINQDDSPTGEAFQFMIWTHDGEPDTFRIKIWHEDGDEEDVVYDNDMHQPINGRSVYCPKFSSSVAFRTSER
jgi:hypothetical protein